MENIKNNLQLADLENPDDGANGDNKWYKCIECNFGNGLASNYDYHMSCHTRNQRIKCPLCSFSAKTKLYVAHHLKLDHLNWQNVVPKNQSAYLEEMNYVIDTLLNIRENLQLEQSSIDENHDSLSSSVNQQVETEETCQYEESIDISTSTFTYKCTKCNYSTDHPANVELHEKAHNQGEGKEFQCTLCNYSSNLKFMVIRHMKRDHQCPENQHYLQAKEKDTRAAKFESMDFSHQENPDIKSNNDSHLKSEEIGTHHYITQKFEFVDLCNDDDDEDEPKTDGMMDTCTDKFEILDACHLGNPNIKTHTASSLQSNKEMTTCFIASKIEIVDLCDEDDKEPKENSIRIRPWANTFEQEKSIGLIEGRVLDIGETECRKRISQYREDIRKARFSMTEMRNKIKLEKRILSEKMKQKEIKSSWLAKIRANNQKVVELSLEYKKLETLRDHKRKTSKRKLESVFQLRKLIDQQHLHNCVHYLRGDNIVVDLVKSDETEAMIGWLKNHIDGIENELEFLEKEEIILARDVGLLYKSVNDGIGRKVSDQKLQLLEMELEEIEREVQAFLLSKTEDVFNQLIILTEEKVRNLFVLKNNLLDIMSFKRNVIRRMN